MPYDWTTNWIKPLHKDGDVSNINTISNHQGWLPNCEIIWMYNGIKDKSIGWKKW